MNVFRSLVSSEREKTRCEQQRASAVADSDVPFSLRPRPTVGRYVPRCDERGAYEPTQCHQSIGQCWCVDANGQEVPNTRTGPHSSPPLCESLFLLIDVVLSENKHFIVSFYRYIKLFTHMRVISI